MGLQPVRARMCGFGDKDRRLLTPPVIAELLVYDSRTGTPISTEFTSGTHVVHMNSTLLCIRCFAIRVYDQLSSAYDNQVPVPGPSGQTVPIPGSAGQTSAISSINHLCGPSSGAIPPSYPRPALDSPAKPNGEIAYTRNLIGALAQSASRLQGMDGQPGIFFIFHDLSGFFVSGLRLLSSEIIITSPINPPTFGINVQRAIPSVFREKIISMSQPPLHLSNISACHWHSHSPGMLGPTALTKHFSGQRVRIPTRRRKVKDEGAESTDEEVEDDEN
ncbi:hypothetical protein PSTT_04250 [Puccinia striiformis]|uniref:Velvet domain-containing protein n=1 Tax=Puccinia striiformis TaxID=27350 RepID=A0A2S4VSQ2_9BASI|nr:hypothetical protein PSTT_04250 [Puccinia striiformis]